MFGWHINLWVLISLKNSMISMILLIEGSFFKFISNKTILKYEIKNINHKMEIFKIITNSIVHKFAMYQKKLLIKKVMVLVFRFNFFA